LGAKFIAESFLTSLTAANLDPQRTGEDISKAVIKHNKIIVKL